MAALQTETPQINDSLGLKWKSNSAPKYSVDFSAFVWCEIQFNKVRSKVWREHKTIRHSLFCSIFSCLLIFLSKCNFLCLWSCYLKELMLHSRNFNFCIFEFSLSLVVFVQSLPRPTSFNHFVNNALWVGFYKTDNISEDIKVAHSFYWTHLNYWG